MKIHTVHNYGELALVTNDYDQLLKRAEKVNNSLAQEYRDAFFELVLHPVKACANLQNMYAAVAYNHAAAAKGYLYANQEAEKAKAYYQRDSLITLQYHSIANGKWNHMMSQTHIGYTYWQQPSVQKMPELQYVSLDSSAKHPSDTMVTKLSFSETECDLPPGKGHVFNETDGYVSIEAADYTKAINTNGITWKVLPDLGRTGSAVTAFPVTAANQTPGGNGPQLVYDLCVNATGTVKLYAYFSPTLNFNNDEGLKYAVSIDNEKPQIMVLNKDDNQPKIWSKWVADNIIIKTTDLKITGSGKHVLRYWMISAAVVLQKLVLDMGGLKESYLGPPETMSHSSGR